jgi:hypothetical protein
MSALDALRRDYRAAFLHYLPRREEAALHRGYELGRAAVADGLSLLDLARVHHDVLVEELRQTPTGEVAELATAASEFLVEVLATSDMTQRGYLAGHRADAPGPPAGERVQGSPTGGSDGTTGTNAGAG